MVDYASKYRLYSYGYTAINPRASVPTMRELYHEAGRKVFSARKDRPVHDCRGDVAKRHATPQEWDAWLLSHGLQATYDDVLASHDKKEDSTCGKKKPDKLLYTVGIRGSAKGDFVYPRGLCTTVECEIAVADSHNHRVQVLNQFGVFKLAFGTKGAGDGEFNEPTDVAEMPNGDFAVADRRNKRVQPSIGPAFTLRPTLALYRDCFSIEKKKKEMFSEEGEYQSQLGTGGQEPYSVASDQQYNLAVATTARTVQLFHEGRPTATFPVPSVSGQKASGSCPLHVGLTDSEEVVVSDPLDQLVKVFSFQGALLRQFRPHCGERLACGLGGISITVLGQVLVADTLNHSVSLFTTTGTLLKQVLVPTDDLGCLHSLAVGPEGHLVVSEFSMTGPHSVKIFRYRECPCHEGKTGSSKKRTPATSPDQ